MEIDDYQARASTTMLPTAQNREYLLFNIMSELGEYAGIHAKAVRDQEGELTEDQQLNAKKELGDILWHVAMLAKIDEWKLSDIGQMNLDKLAGRASRGTISGSGDNR